jgi:putative transposase
LRTHIDWLRRGEMYAVIRRVLEHFLGRDDFRICHLSIQKNHIHFLIEAADRKALWKGMQSLASRCAHAINAACGFERRAKVFTYRYHSTQITKPWQARSALAYVLNNWRKHSEDLADPVTMKAKLDPYSSAISFHGWAGENGFAIPVGYNPLPVSPPQTALLLHDWKRYGYIGCFEVPGPVR